MPLMMEVIQPLLRIIGELFETPNALIRLSLVLVHQLQIVSRPVMIENLSQSNDTLALDANESSSLAHTRINNTYHQVSDGSSTVSTSSN